MECVKKEITHLGIDQEIPSKYRRRPVPKMDLADENVVPLASLVSTSHFDRNVHHLVPSSKNCTERLQIHIHKHDDPVYKLLIAEDPDKAKTKRGTPGKFHPRHWAPGNLEEFHPRSWLIGNFRHYHPADWVKGKLSHYRPAHLSEHRARTHVKNIWEDPDMLKSVPSTWSFGNLSSYHPPDWVYGHLEDYRPVDWVPGPLTDYHPPDWVHHGLANYNLDIWAATKPVEEPEREPT